MTTSHPQGEGGEAWRGRLAAWCSLIERRAPDGDNRVLVDAEVADEHAADVRALLDSEARLAGEVEALKGESADLTKALTGLTRMGSEYFIRKGDRYVADIPACVGYVRMVREDGHKALTKALRDKKAAESQAQAAIAQRDALTASLEWLEAFADLRAEDDAATFKLVARGAFGTVARRARQALASLSLQGKSGSEELRRLRASPCAPGIEPERKDGVREAWQAVKDDLQLRAKFRGETALDISQGVLDRMDAALPSKGGETR